MGLLSLLKLRSWKLHHRHPLPQFLRRYVVYWMCQNAKSISHSDVFNASEPRNTHIVSSTCPLFPSRILCWYFGHFSHEYYICSSNIHTFLIIQFVSGVVTGKNMQILLFRVSFYIKCNLSITRIVKVLTAICCMLRSPTHISPIICYVRINKLSCIELELGNLWTGVTDQHGKQFECQ
jgi:hypothetical protein